MNQKKNILKKRVSNRRYPLRMCKKPDCQEGFVPSDSRQIYCCDQHRIDFNNDKRKQKEAITVLFLKKLKSNRDILKKIKSCAFYKKYGYATKFILDHEDYDFDSFNHMFYNEKTGREVHVCYEFTLELIDSTKQNFLIKNTLDYEL